MTRNTGSTETDITSGDPTVDPCTTGTSDTSGDDTTTGGASHLCTRLGGMADDGIPALVNGFLGKVLVDEKINGYFLNSDVDAGALGTCVINQIGALAGCEGVVYDCKDMQSAHMGLGISQADFDDFVMDFVAAYDEHVAAHPDLTDDDKTTIGGALGGMDTDIVEDATSDATVYQRVGCKSGIKALIGHPGEMGSFVDNVAMDPAIAGFFMMSDFERLNTCLTRQVASIDGPIKYGAEVTAPDGIDPGVAIDNPCRDMKSAHAGLMDDMMSPITIDDFMALVADLVTAMTTAGVSDADQTAILSVLGPMCDDIVADPNIFHHYYDLSENKAKPIDDLISSFEKFGSAYVRSYHSHDSDFTAKEWAEMSPKQKDDTLMNYRLAYRKTGYVNWCEALGSVLANDEVKDGLSERGGHPVEKKAMMQWSLRITAYAERLLQDLDTLEWSDALKSMQRNWIGRSEGAQMFFEIVGHEEKLEIFTTRPDTIFGATYLVLAPEHDLVKKITTTGQNKNVQAYLEYVNSRSEIDRMSEVK